MKLTTAKWYMASGRAIEKPERWAAGEEEDDEEDAGRPEYRTAAGRIVYGGGGVTPDIEIDFERRPDVVVDLERREEFFEFAIEYTATHPIEDADFTVDESMWDAFVEFLVRDGFEVEESALEEHRDEIELAIRRDLIRKSLGREEAYAAAVRGDDQLTRTVQLAAAADDVEDLFRAADDYVEAAEE
jgi:carboxyl-terminal processing protease